MSRRRLFIQVLLQVTRLFTVFLLSAAAAQAQQAPRQSAPSAPAGVKFSRDGLKLELAPVPPDAVRAFFMGRGFAKKDAELLVHEACIFRSAIGSAFTSAGGPQVTIDLAKWQILRAGKEAMAPRLREAWMPLWRGRKVSEDARVAFYWSLFPTRQSFAPVDYNWGMITFALAAGTSFDLKLAWQSGSEVKNAILKGLTCAK